MPTPNSAQETYEDFLLDCGNEASTEANILSAIFRDNTVSNNLKKGLREQKIKLPTEAQLIAIRKEMRKQKNNNEFSLSTYLASFLNPDEKNTQLTEALTAATSTAIASQVSTPKASAEEKSSPRARYQAKKKETNGQSLYDDFIKRPDIVKSPTFLKFLNDISPSLINALNTGIKLPSEQEIVVMFSEIQKLDTNRFKISELIIKTFGLHSQNIGFTIVGKLPPETIKILEKEIKEINSTNLNDFLSGSAQAVPNSDIDRELKQNTPPLSDDAHDFLKNAFSPSQEQTVAYREDDAAEATIPDNPNNSLESRKIIMPINIKTAVGLIKNNALKTLLAIEENLSLLNTVLDRLDKANIKNEQDLANFLEKLLGTDIPSAQAIKVNLSTASSQHYNAPQIQTLSQIIYRARTSAAIKSNPVGNADLAQPAPHQDAKANVDREDNVVVDVFPANSEPNQPQANPDFSGFVAGANIPDAGDDENIEAKYEDQGVAHSAPNEGKTPDAPDNVIESRKTIMPINIQESINAMQNSRLKKLLNANLGLLENISPAGKANPSNKDLTDIFDSLAGLKSAEEIEIELRYHNVAESEALTKLSKSINASNIIADFDYEEEAVPVDQNPPQPEPDVEAGQAQPIFDAGANPQAGNEPNLEEEAKVAPDDQNPPQPEPDVEAGQAQPIFDAEADPQAENEPNLNEINGLPNFDFEDVPEFNGPLPIIDGIDDIDDIDDEPAPPAALNNEQKLARFIQDENIQHEFVLLYNIIEVPQVKQAILDSWNGANQAPPTHVDYINLLHGLSLNVENNNQASEAIATLFHLPTLTPILQAHGQVNADTLSFVATQIIEARNPAPPHVVPVPAAPVVPNNGQMVFDALIANPQIAAMTTLVQVLNNPNVNQHLIDYWNIPGSFRPTPENLITALASARNSAAEMRNALIRNLFLIAPPAIPAQAAPFNAALNQPNNISTKREANNIRGEARYQKLINDPTIPEVAAGTLIGNFLRDARVKTDLINHWKIIGNNPPNQASINALIAAFNGPALRPAEITAAFANAFGVGAFSANSADPIATTAAAIAAAALVVPPPPAPAARNGQHVFENLINNPLLAPLAKLREALTNAAVQTALVTYWSDAANPPPVPNAAANLVNAVIAAPDAAGVRNAIANLTNPPTNLLGVINTSGILADAGPLANNIRSETIYQNVINNPTVIASPQLVNFLRAPLIQTALATHWNNFANVAPVMANIPAFITALTANPAQAAAAVRAAFDNAFGPVALSAQIFNDELAVLRGQGPYNTFVTSPDFLNMPRTFQDIMQTANIKDIMIRHWSTNPTPTDISTLLDSFDPELGLDAATTRRAIANAFGNPPGLTTALAGAGIDDANPRFQEIKDQAKGRMLVEELLENPAIAAIPEIKALFQDNNNAVAQRLAAHFGANRPNIATLSTSIVTALANARNAAAMENVFNNPAVFGVNLAIPAGSLTAAQMTTLRGKARLQQLLSDENNAAILNDMPALATLLNHPTLKDGVINSWGNFGHIRPIENRIITLRNALALATTVAEVQTAFGRFSSGTNAHINAVGTIDIALVNTLRTQALKNSAENNLEALKRLRNAKYQHIEQLKIILSKPINERNLRELDQHINLLITHQHLNTNHELYQAALQLQNLFTRNAAGDVTDVNNPAAYSEALEIAKAAQQKLMNSANQLYDTNANTPDQGLNAYQEAATYYKQQTLKSPNEEESKRIEGICYKMQDDLELAESKLLDRIAELKDPNTDIRLYRPSSRDESERLRADKLAYREEMLETIKQCRADLKETLGNIEANRRALASDKKVNCYSDQSELIENSNERIMEKVHAYQTGAAARPPTGNISLRIKAEITHTKPFGAKARINYTELTNADSSTAKFVSVQRTQGKLFKSELYHDPQDIANLDTLNLIKLAAREVENFYAAMPEKKGYRLNLRGNMHPKFADAIINYCALKGYAKPISSIPKYESNEDPRYQKGFREIYKRHENEILVTAGDASHVAMTKERVDKLDKVIDAPPVTTRRP